MSCGSVKRPRGLGRSRDSGVLPSTGRVRDWNRVYGNPRILQYQFVVEDAEVVRHALEKVSEERRSPVFLAVLKRFGPGNASPLSFPRQVGPWPWTYLLTSMAPVVCSMSGTSESWQRAADLPGQGLPSNPRHLEAMYPRLAPRIRERVDQRRCKAATSRRLGIEGFTPLVRRQLLHGSRSRESLLTRALRWPHDVETFIARIDQWTSWRFVMQAQQSGVPGRDLKAPAHICGHHDRHPVFGIEVLRIHRPNVGEPRRRSTTTSATRPDTQVRT